MKKTLVVLGSALALLCTACNKDDEVVLLQDHDANKMMAVMHQMENRMDTMQMTNDPDVDFARMMRTHHMGAIDMANLELQEGKDDSMKLMAQRIIDEQQAEIKQLDAILAQLTVDNSDPDFTMEQMENMKKGSKVADEQLITGDIDNDFATLMIVHHQGAVDNASAYLHHGNSEPLRVMANSIVTSQVEEIQILAGWLIANKR